MIDNARVFLVDRDPHVCRLVQHFLGKAYDVEVFEDGYTALDRAREEPPAAVITEILVPKLDGLALCRLLKSDPLTSHVPVLIFSSLSVDARVRDAGADAFLEKPLERTNLIEALRELIRSTVSSPPAHPQ